MTKSFKLTLSLLVCATLIVPVCVRLLAAAADVSGTWAFVLNTDGGDRNATATFKVKGRAVTGTWDEKTEVKGTFANGALDLSFPLDSPEVGPGTLAIKAKLAKDELTGSWSFQQYNGTLKATRVTTSTK